MASTVEITSNNFSGQQATVVFTPINSEISYVIGTYSINIINTNCTHILVIK